MDTPAFGEARDIVGLVIWAIGFLVDDAQHTIVVGYNFGQLSFAQADKSESTKSAAIEF